MKRFKLQVGLSLIELMVGLFLSALLLFGVLQIFDGNRRTYILQDSFSQVQESGRIAIDMLSRELRNAAFDGCGGQASLFNHYSASFHFSQNGINGKNNVGENEIIGGKEVMPETDVLIVSGAVDACGGRGRVLSTADSQIQFQGTCSLTEPSQGESHLRELIMLANCNNNDITSITAVKGSTLTTAHSFGPSTYGEETRIYQPFVRTYFIRKDGDNFGLYMSENGFNAQELVPGVEDLQLSFGRASGSLNRVVNIWQTTAGDRAQREEIAAVRIQLVVTATGASDASRFSYTRLHENNSVEVDDGRLRKEYRVLTKLRNRGVR